MNMTTQLNRLDYLDAVRAFALILGIVFHASLSFMPIYIGWAVMDVSTGSAVSVFMLVSHSFRMALFFLVAGFFSHMAFHSKGAPAFLKSRLVRIAVPFVVGWFILRPLLVSGWIMGAESMRGEANLPSALLAGFASLGQLPSGLFVGSHLWFLYYLMLVTAGILVLRWLVSLHTPLQSALSRAADTAVAWISSSRMAIPVIAIPTSACLWFMPHWGLDTPDKSLVPNIPVLLIYTAFFLFGWLLHREKGLIEQFARLTWSRFALCVIAVAAAIVLAGFQSNPGHPQYPMLKAGFALSYAVMMWSLISLTIGLFKRFLDRPSAIVRYVADSSYWLYLSHLPIVIWLQVAVAELPLHWSIKLPAISVATIAISLLLYDLLVRSTFIGATLNGRRKPRVLFLFGKHVGEDAKASVQASG
ncbi:MAG: acyltransferase family protein [Gammaproteobacteria bacterium]|nr:acyltransferase family protein [Gammaproteobacteria bacterium]